MRSHNESAWQNKATNEAVPQLLRNTLPKRLRQCERAGRRATIEIILSKPPMRVQRYDTTDYLSHKRFTGPDKSFSYFASEPGEVGQHKATQSSSHTNFRMEKSDDPKNLRLLWPVIPTRPTGQNPNLLLLTGLPGRTAQTLAANTFAHG